MSEKLPYEEHLDHAWDDLPLPDENMAWKDMKRRLDEDDDEKIVVPPPKRGCGIGALLIGLLLLGGLWFLVRPEKWFMSKEKENEDKVEMEVKNRENKKNESEIKKNENVKTLTDSSGLNSSIQNTSKNETGSDIKAIESNIKSKQRSEPVTIKDEVSIETKTPKTTKKKTEASTVKTNKPKEVSVIKNNKEENVLVNEESVSDQKKKNEIEEKLKNGETQKKDSVSNEIKPNETKTGNVPVKDTAIGRKIDTTIVTKKPDSIVSNSKPEKQKEKEKKPIFFAAGIGLHQQIPIAGQEWTTYGSLGRKGILSDYIPSVNFRMEKQDRWFLQSEFRYGAPQHTKQFTYNQIIKIDTPNPVVTTNSLILKKTFYHQVPLTFNYYVLPNWSVGTGVQWNRFSSAVAEESISRRLPGSTNDSLLSQKIVKISADSSGALAKSWFQGIIQTQYQWKRFSIGARYSFGLQPYIKFTLPNQPLQEEKNSSLQIFLRYELWRSKK